MQTVTLSDGKAAAEVVIDGATRYVRVRRVSSETLPNESSGVAFYDAAVKVQPYEVDAAGTEVKSGPVVGSTFHGAEFVNGEVVLSQDDLDRMTARAVDSFVAREVAEGIRQAVPEELI